MTRKSRELKRRFISPDFAQNTEEMYERILVAKDEIEKDKDLDRRVGYYSGYRLCQLNTAASTEFRKAYFRGRTIRLQRMKPKEKEAFTRKLGGKL